MSIVEGMKILVAEDDRMLLKVTALSLRRKGAIVTEALNGKEAFQFFLSENFDLILSDVQMPEMNGIELLAKVREKHKSLPVFLFVTGQSQLTAEESLKLGAAALIKKPFRLNEVMQLINGIYEKNSKAS